MRTTAALDRRLDLHFATLRTAAFRAGNWQRYAAVTGSALAMATSAAANVVYSGPLNQSTPVLASANQTTQSPFTDTLVGLKTAGGGRLLGAGYQPIQFYVGVGQQFHSSGKAGYPVIYGKHFGFLHSSASPFVRKLQTSAAVTASAGTFYRNTNHIGLQFRGPNGGASGSYFSVGWPKSQTGLAGFEFQLSRGG
jgi:hypothetical protein